MEAIKKTIPIIPKTYGRILFIILYENFLAIVSMAFVKEVSEIGVFVDKVGYIAGRPAEGIGKPYSRVALKLKL